MLHIHSLANRARSLVVMTTLLSVVLSGCTSLKDFLAPLGGTPEPELVEETPIEEMPRLEPLSRNYFELETAEQTVIGEPQIVFTSEEHTFSDLAREYGLGYDEIVAANPDIDPWLPGAGTAVLLPTQFVLPDVPHEGIVLNIASKRLFYFPALSADEDKQTVLTYPIGIGRVGWETPLGHSEVIAKARDPHWYVPASVRREHEELGDPLPAVVPPGPDNPLGKHVLKLDLPGYLIHGTNQPYGVGMRVSHGCVRLYPENIELLYELVGLGEAVRIVNEPYLAGQHDGAWYFEAHTPLEDDAVTADEHMQAILEALSPTDEKYPPVIDAELLQTIAADGFGMPTRLADAIHVERSAKSAAVTERRANEVMARARVIRNTVTPDPDMPTLEEVRALLDEPLDETEVADQVAVDERITIDE